MKNTSSALLIGMAFSLGGGTALGQLHERVETNDQAKVVATSVQPAFTYQGRLKHNGEPLVGYVVLCCMTVRATGTRSERPLLSNTS